MPCCPKLVTSFIIGNYSFFDSSISPPNSITVNGTTLSFKSGIELQVMVSPVGDSGDVQTLGFVWPNQFNESAPTPANADLFGDTVVFHWYTLADVLYMHVET